MELFGLESNPVPDGATVAEILASDGVRLRAAHWRSAGKGALGTICLLQGRGESIEKYFETISDLRARGFAVATLDWRGQGGSERKLRNPKKGHVDDFVEYDRDLEAFMEQVALPDCPPPHFALAHSTGGLIALRGIRAGRMRFHRLVLSSPLIGLPMARPAPATTRRVAALFTAIGLGELALPKVRVKPITETPFEDNYLTSDRRRFDRIVEMAKALPQISGGVPTYGWLHAATRAMAEVNDPDFAPAIRAPILMIGGSLDKVVSVPAIETLASELPAGSVIVIPGARHELMMERDSLRQQFFAAFSAFVPGS